MGWLRAKKLEKTTGKMKAKIKTMAAHIGINYHFIIPTPLL